MTAIIVVMISTTVAVARSRRRRALSKACLAGDLHTICELLQLQHIASIEVSQTPMPEWQCARVHRRAAHDGVGLKSSEVRGRIHRPGTVEEITNSLPE